MGRGEVDVDAGVLGQPGLDVGVLVGGVVVHHQVQLASVGVGAGDLLEEREELLWRWRGLQRRGDLAGGDLQRGEQGRGAVPDVVVGAAFGQARLQSAGSARSGPTPGSGTSRPRTARSRSRAGSGTARRRRRPWPPARGRWRTGTTPPATAARRTRARPCATVASEIPRCRASSRRRPVRHPVASSAAASTSPSRSRRGRSVRGRPDRVLIVQACDARGLIPVPPGDHRRPRHPDPLGDRRVRQPHPRPAARSWPAAPAPPAPSTTGSAAVNSSRSPSRKHQRRRRTIRHTPIVPTTQASNN